MTETATDYSAVAHYLRMDHLQLEDSALLLTGLDPRGTRFPDPHYDRGDGALAFLDGRECRTGLYDDDPELAGYRRQYRDVIDLWENTDHPSDATRNGNPRIPYLLGWAESRGVAPQWRQWSIDEGLWPAEPKDSSAPPDVSGRERESLLNIVYALKEQCLALGGAHKTQDWLISTLLENHGDRRGVSKTKLREIFAEANKLNN